MSNLYGQSDWKFIIRDKDENNPVRLLAAKNRAVTLGLNAPGQATFSIDLNDEKATQANLLEGRSRLYVYRGDTLYFSGKVMIVERILEEVTQTANVTALGWMWELERRITGKTSDITHSSVDAGAIAWAEINRTQNESNGNIGITQGTIQTSQNLTLTLTRAKVRDVLDDLVTQAGIEFEITPNKIFNVFYPRKGSDKSATVKFQYPGNIKSARPLSDATVITNDLLALGRGLGAEEITSDVEDTGSKSVFGLFQDVMSFKDVDNQTALTNMSNYYLNLLKSSRLTLDISVHGNNEAVALTDYVVGDTVRITIDHPNYSLDQLFRIFEIHVTIGDDDKETIRLVTALV